MEGTLEFCSTQSNHIKLIISETSMIKTMIKALLTIIRGLLWKCRSTSINQSRISNFESCQNGSRVVIWPLKIPLFIHHESFAWKHNSYNMFSLVINHATTKRLLLPFCCLFSSPERKAHGWANSIPVSLASVRRLSVRPSIHNFKYLLFWNHWANLIQISYGDSLGHGKESLFKWSWSHDQDGRHAHIW